MASAAAARFSGPFLWSDPCGLERPYKADSIPEPPKKDSPRTARLQQTTSVSAKSHNDKWAQADAVEKVMRDD